MTRKLFKREEGFTLMEVLVVVIIVAILAAVGVPIYTNYVKQARASEAQSAIGAIYNASKMYYQDTGEWPNDIENQLESEGYINLDQSLMQRWEFEIIGSNPITTIQAVSTSEMKGGEGHVVTYNVETGEFTGYGVLGAEGELEQF